MKLSDFQKPNTETTTLRLSDLEQPKSTQPADVKLGATRSWLQGITLGWADEIGIGVAALAAKATGADAPLGEIYDEMKEEYEYTQGEFEKQHPKLSLGMEIAGGLTTGVAGGAKAAGQMAAKKGLQKLAGYGASGAKYGAVAGAGYADSGETTEGAIKGALSGAAFGVAIPAIGSLAMKAAKPFIDRLLGKAGSIAKRQIEKDLSHMGLTADDAAEELLKLGPDATLADVAESLMRRAQRIAQLPGHGEIGSKFYELRNERAAQRIAESVNKMFGGRIRLVDAVDDVIARTEKQASPLFEKAYKQYSVLPAYITKQAARSPGHLGVTASKTTREIVNPGLAKLSNTGMVQDAIRIVNKRYRSLGLDRKITPENMGLKDWHEVRKALDGIAYGRIKTSATGKPIGDTAIARNLRNRLDKQLEKLTGGKAGAFKQADAIYSGQAKAIEAMEKGEKFWTTSPDKIRYELSKMSQSERDAYRLAGLQRLYDEATKISEGGSAYSRIFNNIAKKERIKALLQDNAAFREFERLLKTEQTFNRTYALTRTGSQTARNQAAGIELAVDPSIAVDVVRGRFGSAAMGVIRKAEAALTTPSERQRRELTNLLMSPGEGAKNALAEIASRQHLPHNNPLIKARIGESVSRIGAIMPEIMAR